LQEALQSFLEGEERTMQYPPRSPQDPKDTNSCALASEHNFSAEERLKSQSSTSPASDGNFYLNFDFDSFLAPMGEIEDFLKKYWIFFSL